MSKNSTNNTKFWIALTAFLLLFIIFSQLFEINLNIQPKASFLKSDKDGQVNQTEDKIDQDKLKAQVIASEGIELPIEWGDLGKQMVETGVIDEEKFRELFGGKLTQTQEKMLTGTFNEKVIMDKQNSRFILDLLWALGLGNKNPILENGEMTNEKYGGAENFASTGGWTLAKGDVMDHYSKHRFVTLTDAQQKLVENVSKGIYRPCCGNSTYFPDCNHGMAMLGLLELMAAQGANEKEMYRTALAVNSIWFPQTYLDLATYFAEQGQDWQNVDPKLVLGSDFSSAQGYQATRPKIKSLPKVDEGGGGCGA